MQIIILSLGSLIITMYVFKEWEDVKLRLWSKVKKLKKHIPDYGYSDSNRVYSTDEKFCGFVIQKLRDVKWKIVDVLNMLFETGVNNLEMLEKTKNEIDMFLDEVKIRELSCRRSITSEVLDSIVEYDFNITEELEKLKRETELLFEFSLKIETPANRMFDEKDIVELNKKVQTIEKHVKKIREMFEERDKLINLKKLHLLDFVKEKIKTI